MIWKMFLQDFPKMQKLFAKVIQNRCFYKFLDIHKKLYVLGSLLITFSCEYHKMFENSFVYGTPPVVASENGWRISRISNSTWNISREEFIKEKEL